MSRNKYPEETYQLILETALKLFMVKGYVETSIQDIADEMKMTKGAVYHHFKTKEDILIAAVNLMCRDKQPEMDKICADKSLTGAQKIEAAYNYSLNNEGQISLMKVVPSLLDNPYFLAYYIKTIYLDVVLNYIKDWVMEGKEDGSIITDYPNELSSLIMTMTDFWLNPLVLPCTPEETVNKGKVINEILKPYNLKLFNEKTLYNLSLCSKYANKIE